MTFLERRQQLLDQMQSITRMERGKLCTQSRGPASAPFYKLQCWQNGKNLTRYVPSDEVPALQQALAGHERFQRLAKDFVELTVAHTRAEPEADAKKKPRKSSPSAIRKPKRS